MKWEDRINDQPGRYIAVFFVAPIIFHKGLQYNDAFLVWFAMILFFWDSYWLFFKKPCYREGSC